MVQWCISWKLQQVSNRDIKLAVFPALRMFRPGPQNHYFVLFCQKIAQNTPWWVLGALVPTNSIMSISFWNLRYEMDHTCCWLFCNFKCQLLHVHLQDNFFVVLFTKEYINFSYLNEKSKWFSSEICFGYFEQIWKEFSDYQIKTN